MPYTFGPRPAIDPSQPNILAKDADGLIYSSTDTAFASPLSVTDLSGASLPFVHVGATGLTQSFIAPAAQVVWRSGAYAVVMESYQAVLDQMNTSIATVNALRDQVTSALSLLGSGGGGTGGVTDHGALTGLGDDDHLQYLTTGRGDARYYPQGTADTKLSAAISTSSALDRNRALHSGSQATSSITGLDAALANRAPIVPVSTGLEARPAGVAAVIWADLRSNPTAPPVNMQAGTDIYFSQVPTQAGGGGGSTPADTAAPTVPAGLTASGVTSSGFTVSWNAATDNTGVTGYEVQIGGVTVGTPTGTSLVVTGRASSTAYSVTVRARDAVPNWSAYSSPLIVTTSAGSSVVEHSVYGATAIPNAGSGVIYSVANGIVAQGFRLAALQTTDWRVKGARLYTPNVTGTVPTTATVYVFKGPSPTLSTITTTNAGTATMTGIAKGAWAEVRFPTPVTFNYYDRIWICLKFASGTFFVIPPVADTRYPATDGSAIGLESSDSRGQQYDPVSGQTGQNAVWGLDLITDAGA